MFLALAALALVATPHHAAAPSHTDRIARLATALCGRDDLELQAIKLGVSAKDEAEVKARCPAIVAQQLGDSMLLDAQIEKARLDYIDAGKRSRAADAH
jgi:hypothetical protein